jgi:hypothetical protein
MNYGRFFVGTVLVVLGALLALGAADVLDAGEVIGGGWPLVIMLGAVLMLVAYPRRWQVPAAIFVVAGLLLLDTSGVADLDLWQFIGPAVIIVVGLSLITGRSMGGRQEVSEDRIGRFILFSGAQIASRSPRFSGGSVTVIFGGADIDLHDATPADGAALDTVAIFGGIDIRVPQGWDVVIHGMPLFGGFDNITGKESLPPDAPRLVVQGLALFGGVEVRH